MLDPKMRAHDIAIAALPIIHAEQTEEIIREAEEHNESEVHIQLDIYEIYKEIYATALDACLRDFPE